MKDNYRDVPDDKIIDVPETPGFGMWRRFFDEDARKHPAKMNQNLLRWILTRYTREGETVLDPMAGTFSTVVQAALMGRHGVGVEYEQWMKEIGDRTLNRVKKHPSLLGQGTAVALKGDARELTEVVGAADALVTSPPHGDVEFRQGKWYKRMRVRMGRDPNQPSAQYANYDVVVTSPPHSDVNLTQDTNFRGLGHKGRPPAEARRDGYKAPDAIITSPPQGPDVAPHGEVRPGDGEPLKGHNAYDTIVTSPPYAGPYAAEHSKSEGGKVIESMDGSRRDYSGDPENIGHRQYGEIDAVITSPPHGDVDLTQDPSVGNQGHPIAKHQHEGYDAVVSSPPHGPIEVSELATHGIHFGRKTPDHAEGAKNDEERIRVVKERHKAGVRGYHPDAMVSSPPYPMDLHGGGIAKTGPTVNQGLKNPKAASEDPENLGNLAYGDVDAIVTSPPYEDRHPLRSNLDQDFVDRMSEASVEGGSHAFTTPAELEYLKRVQEGLKTTEGNIGREKRETYIEAMARVYRESWKVLKPGGLIVIVVKNFVRDGKPVRLDEDTAKLLRWAGFEDVDHLYRKLNAKSFWIRNYEKKFRERQAKGTIPKEWPIPTTNFEDVLVFRKARADSHSGNA